MNKTKGDLKEKEKSPFFIILSLMFCVFSFLYLIYMFIFQMECIIYNGKKPNGKIDWIGTVLPTLLLFACCGPCMFLYRLFNRCTNNSMNNVRRNNVRNNTVISNSPINNSKNNQ